MPRVTIARRKFAIRAEIYDPKTATVSIEEFIATGRAAMYGAERAFLEWCWSQGFVGRIKAIEDISYEPDKKEYPDAG